MSALSTITARVLAESLASVPIGNTIANMLNEADAMWNQSSKVMAAVIVAAHTSTTTDFAALAVGDLLVHIPATAGNAAFETVATAGTKPSAAVVGDLYIALRSKVAPTPSNIIL
jgi:hypothetical protein